MNQHFGQSNSQIKRKNLIQKDCHATSRKQVEDFTSQPTSLDPSDESVKIRNQKKISDIIIMENTKNIVFGGNLLDCIFSPPPAK